MLLSLSRFRSVLGKFLMANFIVSTFSQKDTGAPEACSDLHKDYFECLHNTKAVSILYFVGIIDLFC